LEAERSLGFRLSVACAGPLVWMRETGSVAVCTFVNAGRPIAGVRLPSHSSPVSVGGSRDVRRGKPSR
jgi:hypothetical protein